MGKESEPTQKNAIPHIDPSTLQELVNYAVSFSAANGLQVEQKQETSSTSTSTSTPSYTCAPISLLPNAYPSKTFVHATTLAPPFNELVDRISRDGDFLRETLKDVRDVDLYTGKLLELYEEIYLGMGTKGGMEWGNFARKADRLGILRSDYMLHKTSGGDDDGSGNGGEYALKQVELNTIASSFAGLASTVARLHGFLTERMEGPLKEFLGENERVVCGEIAEGAEGDVKRGVPQSLAMTRLPSAMALAHDRYCKRFQLSSSPSTADVGDVQPVILFVVQPGETNTVDQRMLEFQLWNNHQIGVVRLSLKEIYEKVTLDESTGRLVIQADDSGGDNTIPTQEVTLVYFRAGYAPTDYPSGDNTEDGTGVEWLARERVERGIAAKCPCLGYHLAGTKKVQQELARVGVVERFFPEGEGGADAGVAPLIRTAFAGLYSLGADANQQDMDAVRDVLFHGGEGRYVLKPQREGGGYNFYGKELTEKLRESSTIVEEEGSVKLSPTLSEFILMERLFPPQQRAILLRNGNVQGTGMTISELGCFGTIVADAEGAVVHNEYAGFLLRTKFSGVDEGGVASGFATLSSPFLC